MPDAPPSPEEKRFLEENVLSSCAFLLVGALLYTLLTTVYLIFRLPPTALPPVIAQKVLLFLVLGLFYGNLRRGAFRSQQAHRLLGAVVALCVASLVITAAVGVRDMLTYGLALLLISVGLISLNWPVTVALSALCWLCWALFPPRFWQRDLLALLGFQILGLGTAQIRRQSVLRKLRLQEQLLAQSADLERALAEAEASRQKLDQLVEQRTAQLRLAYDELRLSIQQREEIQRNSDKLQEQLVQSQKMESLGRLAGGVAHDFNNLLTVIMGNLELAQTLGEDNRDFLQQAEIAARRAADVSSQLLAFSRKQVLSVRELNLATTLEGTVRLLERLLGEDVQLEVSYPSQELKVKGDNAQLQQVIMNLGVNARDAMPNGGKLTLTLAPVKRGSTAWALVSVADTGEGISAEILPHIFEPFFTSKPFGQGTGLGLSTVHGIVSQHEGEIEVDSAPGQGATFRVYLPLAGSSPGSESSSSIKIRRPISGGARLLLVEDDEQVRGLALRVLRMSGYNVLSAETGEMALSLAQQGANIDMLVTDVVMPGMDGASLATRLRQLQPDFKVLFVSGYTDDRLAHFGVDSEDVNFLAKPYSPMALCEKVEAILKATS